MAIDQAKGLKGALALLGKSEKTGLLIAFILMVITFQIIKPGYISSANAINILVSMSIVGLVAIAQTYLMISGVIDLSAGSVAAFSGVLAALLLREGWPAPVAIIAVIAIGSLIGLMNATLINKLKFGFFITTFGTMSIFRGLAYIICDGKAIFINNQTFNNIGVARIGIAGIFSIPLSIVIFLAMMLFFGIVLSRTKFGRRIFMLGGNPTAAHLAGINQEKLRTKLFMLSSSLAALGGIVLASRMNSGQPMASQGLEFDAITAAVLGGVALSGGIGSMGGCLIGLLIMQGFNYGLQFTNVQSFWQQVCKGLLLFAALAFDYLRKKQREKSLYEKTVRNSA